MTTRTNHTSSDWESKTQKKMMIGTSTDIARALFFFSHAP